MRTADVSRAYLGTSSVASTLSKSASAPPDVVSTAKPIASNPRRPRSSSALTSASSFTASVRTVGAAQLTRSTSHRDEAWVAHGYGWRRIEDTRPRHAASVESEVIICHFARSGNSRSGAYVRKAALKAPASHPSIPRAKAPIISGATSEFPSHTTRLKTPTPR
jgi:hypothetical protein